MRLSDSAAALAARAGGAGNSRGRRAGSRSDPAGSRRKSPPATREMAARRSPSRDSVACTETSAPLCGGQLALAHQAVEHRHDGGVCQRRDCATIAWTSFTLPSRSDQSAFRHSNSSAGNLARGVGHQLSLPPGAVERLLELPRKRIRLGANRDGRRPMQPAAGRRIPCFRRSSVGREIGNGGRARAAQARG